MPSLRASARLSLVAAALSLLPACGGGGGGPSGPTFDGATAQAFVLTYADLLHAAYGDVVEAVSDLDGDVTFFLGAPTGPALDAARTRWTSIRPFYLQTELARFYDGPIDRASDGPEVFVNAWPLDEAHLDYVVGDAGAGLINDAATFPVLDEATLRGANELGGETHISCGWHALEFLLWGQDLTLGAPAGQRPATDFVVGMGGTAANQARRAQCLATLVDMLGADVAQVRDEWAPVTGDYRTELLGVTPAEALGRIMTGMGTLAFGELRGERLLVPVTTKLAEDEHSCFSDTTHQDHLNDVIGLRNAWLGSYTSRLGTRNVTGTGLLDVALTVNPSLAGNITTILNDLVTLLSSPVLVPFEVAIQGTDADPGRAQLLQAMAKLSEFNTAFSALAQQMGIDISTTL